MVDLKNIKIIKFYSQLVFRECGSAQNTGNTLGKIIAIDKITKEYEFASIGHRNPQGLKYIEDENIIINTEHGPKGGDDINYLNNNGDRYQIMDGPKHLME